VGTSFHPEKPALKPCLRVNIVSRRKYALTRPYSTHFVVSIQQRQSSCLVACDVVTMMVLYYAPANAPGASYRHAPTHQHLPAYAHYCCKILYTATSGRNPRSSTGTEPRVRRIYRYIFRDLGTTFGITACPVTNKDRYDP
jgi:hypothetical protein